MFHKELSFLFTFLMLLSQQGVKAVKLITCEGQTASLSCDRGLIRVLSAAYGRLGSTICFAGRPPSQLSNTACIITTKPFNLLTSRCNGQTSCSVVVNNAAFTDPCSGTYKYLTVSYECHVPGPPPVSLVTCESQTAHLSCAQGVIGVLSALYGRLDSTICASEKPSAQLANTACLITTIPQNILTSRCDGKTSCSVVVNNAAFTDPCPGTYKYLRVSYECHVPAPPPINLVTCESENAHLSCAQGVIGVLSAAYGRLDSAICASGRPSAQLANTACLITTTPFNVLTSRCDWETSCSVVVNNAAFTDPCVGTYKYLNVSYECHVPVPPPTNLITCESQTAQLGCEQGVIEVLSALYGRLDSTTCASGRPSAQLANTDCHITTIPLNVLTTRCDGQTSCSVVVNNAAFTDPCPGTYKYLNVSYECAAVTPPPANLVTCESQTAQLSCEQGIIEVLSADYGRLDSTTCASGRPSAQLANTACLITTTPFDVLASRCDGKTSCSVVVNNGAFTDPCVGTYKYLNVSYECHVPVPPPINLVTCESQIAQLGCAQGVIEVLSADYGRLDSTTCSFERPPEQLANTDCLITTTPFNVLTSRCNGETSCSAVVNNAAFTDPCVGTYKYLNVSYKCVALTPLPPITSIVCQDRTSSISCDPGYTLQIHFAYYGRRDRVTCPWKNREAMSSTCTSPQTRNLQLSCNGKRRCVLHASNANFRDPCPKIHKYLEVSYSCQ